MPIDLPPEKRLPAWLEAASDFAPRLRITRIRLARAVLWLSGRALDRRWFRLSIRLTNLAVRLGRRRAL